MLDAPKDSAMAAAGLSSVATGEDGAAAETVKPGDVDAFWLQRVLNKHYNDADISQVSHMKLGSIYCIEYDRYLYITES